MEFYGYSKGFAAYQHLVEKWGVWLVIAKGLTPIPFKIVAIAAAVAAMNPVSFLSRRRDWPGDSFRDGGGVVFLLGDKVMTLIARSERKLVIISIVLLLAVAVAIYFR